jgi:hypothetical protein
MTTQKLKTTVQGPTWELESEYPSFEDPKFTADLKQAKELIQKLESDCSKLSQELAHVQNEVKFIYNLYKTLI